LKGQFGGVERNDFYVRLEFQIDSRSHAMAAFYDVRIITLEEDMVILLRHGLETVDLEFLKLSERAVHCCDEWPVQVFFLVSLAT
jgi:hypothetical protein